MSGKKISPKKVKGILILYASSGLNQSQLARTYKVSKSTVKSYVTLYENSALSLPDLTKLKDSDIINALASPRLRDAPKIISFYFLIYDMVLTRHVTSPITGITLCLAHIPGRVPGHPSNYKIRL